MQTNYDDIRFVSGTCGMSSPSTLNYEVEFNDSNHAIVWVKIPSIPINGTNICMYYGNSTATTTESPTSVWKSNYGIVYHMNASGTDSTSNNRNRVADAGTPTIDNSVLGYGMSFGTNNAWSMTNMAYWEQQWYDRSHEVLFTTVADVNTRQTILAEGGGINGALMYILNGQLYARWWSESQGWNGGHLNTSISQNTTYHAVMEYANPSTNVYNYSLYLNGKLVGTNNSSVFMNAHSGDGGIAYTNTAKDFHDGSFNGQYFLGSIHEFRVYDTKESNTWINMSAQNMINHQSTVSYNSQETRPDIIQINITSPDTSLVYSIKQNQTLELNGTITCTTNVGNCGNITLNSEYNSSPTIFSVISTFSGSTPMWTPSGQAKSCILNSGQNCNVSWIVNVTDSAGKDYRLRIKGNSNLSTIPATNSKELSIEIIADAAIVFNQTALDFGSFFKNSGNKLTNVSVISVVRNNTNVSVTCLSGNCSIITENFPDGINISELNSYNLTFTCSDNVVGNYNATYGVKSNEDIFENEVFVTCNVNRVYGPIQVTLLDPPENTTKTVGQNRTFTLKANVSCNGTCGNVTAYAIYSQNLGDGSDGSLTVSSANTVVNTYTYLTGNENSGNTTLSVNSTSGFGIGDEILIIQMQNGTGSGSAGTYEFATISSTGVGTITIENSISNSYGSGTFNAISSSVTQIVRVPQYTDVTINSGASITASAWNGFSGGIVVFRSQGTVNTTGYINVSEKGYRGGDCNGCGNNAWGDQGEGTTGIGTNSQSANGIGGGGGYGPTGLGGEPGGGGGHATTGGKGLGQYTSDAIGGGTIGVVDLSSIYFGGGAGGGGDNDNLAPNPEFVDGGGIVIVIAKEIVNARVHAIGEKGIISQNNGGTTGAGAGGSIWLSTNSLEITDVNASGSPTVNGFGSDFGGAGGDGRIRLDFSSISGSNTDPLQGYNGSSTGIFNSISNTPGAIPLWAVTTQPQSCIVSEDGSCIFTWTINASGAINASVNISVIAYSNYSQISSSQSGNVNITIVEQVAPIITLLTPLNNSKILSNGTINFTWSINDDNTNLTCGLYINGILNQTINCTNVGNNSLTLTLSPGYYDWFVEATDSDNLSANSSTSYFTLINNYSMSIVKAITSVNVNQYKVVTQINNLVINNTYNYNYLDFVPTEFNLGSDTPAFSFFNITNGPNYFGKTYVWNLNTTITNVNYSLAAIGDYSVEGIYIVGLE